MSSVTELSDGSGMACFLFLGSADLEELLDVDDDEDIEFENSDAKAGQLM